MNILQPAYLELWQQGQLEARVEKALQHYEECRLCPRNCGVERGSGLGTCRAPKKAVVASFGPHFGEEAVLVGGAGSGTIFFAHCNLACVFCQNHELSFEGVGTAISAEKLGQIMLRIQNSYKCPNLNLVSPTHFVPSILQALLYAVERGFRLPLVYNCGGYESLPTLELLDGIVDIYMPDYKYSVAGRAHIYSKARDYPQTAEKALVEMDRQVGGLKTDGRGLATRGLLIRHLMLPAGLEDTKQVLQFIKDNLSSDCLVNLMAQYYPHHRAYEYPELSGRLRREEYGQAQAFARELSLRLA